MVLSEDAVGVMGRYTFGPEIPRLSCPGCGRPEHGSTACNPIAPIIVVDEGEFIPCASCKGYKAVIRDAILRLIAGEDPETVANVLMAAIAPD